MSDLADPALAVAAHGLARTRLRLPTGPLDDQTWTALMSRTTNERLGGLLAHAVADGALEVSPGQRDAVVALHEEEMRRALLLEATLLEVTDLLGGAGVETRVLKGLAVAHLDFADPSLRCFSDVDILVRSSDMDHAVALLERVGQRDLPERRPGFDRRFGKDATIAVRLAGEECRVDLHRTLALGRFGLAIRLEDLWRRSASLWVGGIELQALGLEERFLHACYNGLLGDVVPRLVALRDVAQISSNGALDLDRVRALGEAWRGQAVIFKTMCLARDKLGLEGADPLLAWTSDYRPSLQVRIALRTYGSQGGNNTATLLSGVLGLRRLKDAVAYLRALVFPKGTYVQARRASGRPREWRTGLRELRPGTRRRL